MNISLQPISYKDGAGFVIKKKDGYYRYVTREYILEFEHLIQSGLYKKLTDLNLLIPHQEVENHDTNNNYYKVLFPQQIALITYPFEWTYSQWQEMALAYLHINQIALQHGMILKDASPYNFIFENGNCFLLDTLSFRFFKDGEPWMAYRQFCEEILSPLVLMRYNNPLWAKLYQSSITGLPLAFVSKQLPFKTWFNSSCLLHIHWHSKFQNRKEKNKQGHAGFTQQKLNILLILLKKSITAWDCSLVNRSIWDHYYEEGIEEEKYLVDKTVIIHQWLSEINPAVTIDVGANTGKFSFIAARYSQQVVAVENDLFCVEKIRKESKLNKIKNIDTIVADITEPSPDLGWDNAEKKALIKRLNGDMVMALALLHHLCLSKNIPLDFIAKTIAGLTTQYAIVEFIPKDDSKTKLILQNKKDIFKNYTEENFLRSFQNYFKLKDTHSCVSSSRKLYLWEKN